MAFAVANLSTPNAPTHLNSKVLERNSGKKGLLFKTHGQLQVEVHIKADWAGNVTNRSTSSYCTFVRDNLVTWEAKSNLWYLAVRG